MKSEVFSDIYKKDTKNFKRSKQILALRPSEYWLVFFKKNMLPASSFISKIRPRYLFILIPIFLIAFLLFTEDSLEDYMPLIIGSVVVVFILNIALALMDKHDFIHKDAIYQCIKFIIAIKGDVYKNLVKASINMNRIEDDKFSISARELQLPMLQGVSYKPYGIERCKANFKLKDSTSCAISLYQLSLKVSTTKRRSSGKVKTKTKYKHKMFYTLSLKLDKAKYQVMSQEELAKYQNRFSISIKDEHAFFIVKVRHKEKLQELNENVTKYGQSEDSIFKMMIDYAYKKNIIKPTTGTALLIQ